MARLLHGAGAFFLLLAFWDAGAEADAVPGHPAHVNYVDVHQRRGVAEAPPYAPDSAVPVHARPRPGVPAYEHIPVEQTSNAAMRFDAQAASPQMGSILGVKRLFLGALMFSLILLLYYSHDPEDRRLPATKPANKVIDFLDNANDSLSRYLRFNPSLDNSVIMAAAIMLVSGLTDVLHSWRHRLAVRQGKRTDLLPPLQGFDLVFYGLLALAIFVVAPSAEFAIGFSMAAIPLGALLGIYTASRRRRYRKKVEEATKFPRLD